MSGAQALALEREAYPALNELTSKISTLNLERVRQIKSRLVAISGRVQKVSLLFDKVYHQLFALKSITYEAYILVVVYIYLIIVVYLFILVSTFEGEG